MKKEIFEDVLKYLIPYYNVIMSEVLRGKKVNVKKIVEEGIEKGIVEFGGPLKIDLQKLEKEKGKEWVDILKKQLKVFYETIENL